MNRGYICSDENLVHKGAMISFWTVPLSLEGGGSWVLPIPFPEGTRTRTHRAARKSEFSLALICLVDARLSKFTFLAVKGKLTH